MKTTMMVHGVENIVFEGEIVRDHTVCGDYDAVSIQIESPDGVLRLTLFGAPGFIDTFLAAAKASIVEP